MAGIRTLSSLLKNPAQFAGKVVLLRTDLNVPMAAGKVADVTRIERTVPTMRALQKAGAKVVVISHFGRPKGFDADYSLAPIADALSDVLGEDVQFGVDCAGIVAKNAVSKLQNGELVLLENLRFHAEEEKNDPEFSKQLAELGDIYVNDAFSCSHRAHASIEGITHYLPSYAGFLLEEEITNLHEALHGAAKPVAAIVGGSKISTKIDLLARLSQKMDYLMIGGGMANTFLYAQGYDVGKSLYEADKKETALEILEAAKKNRCEILLPTDGIVAKELANDVTCDVVLSDKIPHDQMLLDIGPETLLKWSEVLMQCKTVVWNGPVGAFEFRPFNVGSIALARLVAARSIAGRLMSVAGGGDVLAALGQAGLRDRFTYISTAGGAFLEWLEGKHLPGVKALEGEEKQAKKA